MKTIKFKTVEQKIKAIQVLAKEGWTALREQDEDKSPILSFKSKMARHEAMKILKQACVSKKEESTIQGSTKALKNLEKLMLKLKTNDMLVLSLLSYFRQAVSFLIKGDKNKAASVLKEMIQGILKLDEAEAEVQSEGDSGNALDDLRYYIDRQREQMDVIKNLEKKGQKTTAAYKQLMKYMAKADALKKNLKESEDSIEEAKIKKGSIFSPKEGVKLKVIEPARGFVDGRDRGYWVQVVEGSWQGYKKGEEFTMKDKTVEKHLSKKEDMEEGISSGMKSELEVINKVLKAGIKESKHEKRFKNIKKILESLDGYHEGLKGAFESKRIKKNQLNKLKDSDMIRVTNDGDWLEWERKTDGKSRWAIIGGSSNTGHLDPYYDDKEFMKDFVSDDDKIEYLGKNESLNIAESKLEKDLERHILDYIGNAATGENVVKIKANIIDLVKKIKKKNPEYISQMQGRIPKLMKAVGVDDKSMLNYIRELLEGN